MSIVRYKAGLQKYIKCLGPNVNGELEFISVDRHEASRLTDPCALNLSNMIGILFKVETIIENV